MQLARPALPITALLHTTAAHLLGPSHRAQSGLIRRDREIRIFGYFSFFMHARIISERDFQTIHLKIITHKKGMMYSIYCTSVYIRAMHHALPVPVARVARICFLARRDPYC